MGHLSGPGTTRSGSGPGCTWSGAIDIHIHIQDWSELKPAVLASIRGSKADYSLYDRFVADPGAFVAHMDEIGLARAGLINYPAPDVMGFTERANDFGARFKRHAPDRIIAYGGVHPRLSKDPRAQMRRLFDELGLDALKLHPPHQCFHANGYRDGSAPALGAIYEEAQKRGIPVMVHTGTSIFPGARNSFVRALELDDVGVDFPNLKLILAHLGRPLEMDEVFFLLRRHKNFHADCSGIPPKKLLEYFPRLEDVADKVMFGSDWPSPGVRSIGENLADFRALPLSAQAGEKILVGNATRLFSQRS